MMANGNNLPGLKVDGSGQAGCWIAPGHDDVTAIKVFRLADVQQEEGTVNDRSGDGVLLVEGFHSWGRGWEGKGSRACGGGRSWLASAADGGRAVVEVEAIGGVPGVLGKERCSVHALNVAVVGPFCYKVAGSNPLTAVGENKCHRPNQSK